MCSRWCLLALAAGVLVNVVVAGNDKRVVGGRCSPGRKGSWGLWCTVKSECDGPVESRSNRCVEGAPIPPPRIVCCRQTGPEPPDDVTEDVAEDITEPVVKPVVKPVVEPVTPSSVRRPQWNFGTRRKTTKTTTMVKAPTTTMAAPIAMKNLLSGSDAMKVAKRKCVEYGEHVYVEEQSHTLLVNAETVKEPHCKMVGQKLISGGVLADFGEFPHMVALGYEPPGTAEGTVEWKCGGSLISDRYVLTAAHCVYDRTTGPVRWALLGISELSDAKAQRIKVIEMVKHPSYQPPSIYDDIALLKLEFSPEFSPDVRPACIGIKEPPPNVAPGAFGTPYDVTGWGLVSDHARSENLMKVDLYQVAMEKCDEIYQFMTGKRKLRDGIRRDSMLCIGNKMVGKDSCQGDSGGPAQVRLNGTDTFCMYNIEGVTSFGESTCGGDALKVSVYSRVHYYLPWIVSVVWPGETA